MENKQFNDAELQIIERMALAFENAISHDWNNYQIEAQRVLGLISAKKNPTKFIENIRKKARTYLDRIGILNSKEENGKYTKSLHRRGESTQIRWK